MSNLSLTSYSDDTLDALRDVLPEIEQQLIPEVEKELIQQFQKNLELQMIELQNQASLEFEEAMSTLQIQMDILRKEKKNQLEQELGKLEQEKYKIEDAKLTEAQNNFLEQNFQSRILTHPLIIQIEHKLQEEIYKEIYQKTLTHRQQRLKQLRVKIQNKELKERKQRDKMIKNQIFMNSGLQDLKADISRFKNQIGAKKSENNLKLHRIQQQIKDLRQSIKSKEIPNADLIIKELTEQKQRFEQMQEQFQKVKSDQNWDLSKKHTQPTTQNASSLMLQPQQTSFFSHRGHQPQTSSQCDVQFIDEDIELSSDKDSLDGKGDEIIREQYSIVSNAKSLLPPPKAHQLVDLRSMLNSKEDRFQEEPILHREHSQMLPSNIGELLRKRWQSDSLDRYLSNKQNNEDTSNRQQISNFSKIYSQHLRKLNQMTSRENGKKLSARAKCVIFGGMTKRERQKAVNQ